MLAAAVGSPDSYVTFPVNSSGNCLKSVLEGVTWKPKGVAYFLGPLFKFKSMYDVPFAVTTSIMFVPRREPKLQKLDLKDSTFCHESFAEKTYMPPFPSHSICVWTKQAHCKAWFSSVAAVLFLKELMSNSEPPLSCSRKAWEVAEAYMASKWS